MIGISGMTMMDGMTCMTMPEGRGGGGGGGGGTPDFK